MTDAGATPSDPSDMQFVKLAARLAPYDQQQVLQFWPQLSPGGREQLARQIEAVDLPLIKSLFQAADEQQDWAALSRQAQPPHAVRIDQGVAAVGSAATPLSGDEAIQRGDDALAAGDVGVLLVAGGQGSRLGFDKPKSLYPIGPVSGATLLQIHIEKVQALARRYKRSIPLYLMTSPITHEATVDFLREHKNFGLPDDDLFVFCQGTMPAVDAKTGQLLLADKDRLFLSPDGHGGAVAALAASGAVEQIERRGLKHLFYFQVDNPLTPVCDSKLIGCHLAAKSELTSLAIAKTNPEEKVGNFVTIEGRQHVIEYSDFPSDVAARRDDQGQLVFWAGSVAIHVFEVAFLRRSLELKESLPFHVARKKVPRIDPQGQQVEPELPNALKFEKFIFDLLPHAKNPLVVEFPEHEVFAPLKNAAGAPKDTPEYVRQMMLQQHRRWLTAAGAAVDDDAVVEISPLFAPDARGVAARIEPGARFTGRRRLTAEG